MKPFKWSDIGRKNIRIRMKRLREACADMFHYPDQAAAEILDFVIMPAVSLKWEFDNPLWCQVVGPPGSGKTAHIALYESWATAKFVSRLTKNSLISGFRPEGKENQDPSFIKQLNGKLLVVKDFTCILQGPREERDAVIGQLRDIFDGKASRVFGNVGHMEYTARFNMLLAVTGIIDGFYGVTSQLGERFISRREYAFDRLGITEAALNGILSGDRNDRFAGLKEQFTEFVECLPHVQVGAVHWPAEMKKRAILGADLVATCRSHVFREHDGKSIASRPSPEVGTRLVTQIAQCIASYCIANGKQEVDDKAWLFGGAKIMCDTLPTAVSWTLFQILRITDYCRKMNKPATFTAKDLLPLTRLGWDTTDRIITDLHCNGLLEAEYIGRTGRRSTQFKVKDRTYETIKAIKLFEEYHAERIDTKRLTSDIRKHERRKEQEESE